MHIYIYTYSIGQKVWGRFGTCACDVVMSSAFSSANPFRVFATSLISSSFA